MRKVPLGDVLTKVSNRVRLEPDQEYRTVGVLSYGRGLFERPVVLGREVSYRDYFRVLGGQFVYSKLFAWEGALTTVSPEFDGYFVSQEFPTFDVDTTLAEAPYLRLLTQWPEFWDGVRSCVTGMGGRRQRVHPDRLMDVVVPLPDLAEQRRIVDLIVALDEVVKAAEAEVRWAGLSTDAVIEDWLVEHGGNERQDLRELARMGSGPSFAASDASDAPGEGRVRVLGILNTPQGTDMNLTHCSYVGGLPPTTRLLSPAGLLMIRTNGNRARIGNVYRVQPEVTGSAFSAFQIGIEVHDPENRDFVYWMLRAPSVQRAISEAASGTTGLGNIAMSWLKRLSLPWPGSDERQRAVAVLDGLASVERLARTELQALQDFRGAVLGDLLSGEHSVPASYDRFLASVR